MPKITFWATKQDRFEPGKTYPTYNVPRTIELNYSPLGNEVTITVLGVMAPKHAVIVSDKNNVLTYRDTTNPAFMYEVETTPVDNTIIRVSVKVGGMIEYRYTL